MLKCKIFKENVWEMLRKNRTFRQELENILNKFRNRKNKGKCIAVPTPLKMSKRQSRITRPEKRARSKEAAVLT